MPSGCLSTLLVPFVLTSPWMLTTDQLPVEECLWYSVFLHASKMSSLSELALDDQSFNAFYLTTFKYSSVWYFVLPRDAKDFSEAFKMELVKFLHDGGTRSKIHSCTRAWLAQLFYVHGEYHNLTIVCGATIQSWHFLYLFRKWSHHLCKHSVRESHPRSVTVFIYCTYHFRLMAVYNSYWREIKSTLFKSLIYNHLSTNQIKSSQMLVFGARGKPEYTGENLS